MESKLKPHDIKEVLSIQQSGAFAKLRLRQKGEYTAKGIQFGEDQELDQKFDAQRKELFESIEKREQWIKELKATDNYDQISNELSQDDPYGLTKDANNQERLLEPDAESDYFKGFTQGYKLQELAPDLNEAFIKSGNPDDERIKGMKDATEQHTKDKERDRDLDRNLDKEIWDEMTRDLTYPDRTKDDPDKDKDKDKDVDIDR